MTPGEPEDTAPDTGADKTSADKTGADKTGADKTGAEELDASDPGSASQTPVRRAPVRKAPLARGRKRSTTSGAGETAAPAPAGDASAPDASTPDSSTPDSSTPDSSTPDSSTPDSSTPQTTDDDTSGATVVAGEGLSYRERRKARADSGRPDGGDHVPGADDSKVRYRGKSSAGAKRVALASVCVVAIIACVAVSVVFGLGIHRYGEKNDLRTEYSDFAQQMIVNLTTLNPKNVDGALKTLEDKTSGRAQQQMQDSMKQAVGLVKDQNLTTETTILSDAVTKAEPDEGTVIVVYGWQMKSPDPKEETIVQTFRWRVQMTRINGDLKMTNFEWVT
ncbi:hypothetical protein [Gordonia insulae]|uniref:hypothetical protein n=1 Tax=Gordonia insulae TaxID=2420509 RepID=UPI001E4404A8|nr:hypothetical protein [Gordonia insulae]